MVCIRLPLCGALVLDSAARAQAPLYRQATAALLQPAPPQVLPHPRFHVIW